MLSEERRNQLDEIVSLMQSKNESDDAIQFVVDDFKSKYTDEPPVSQGVGGLGGVALGFGKGALGTATGIARGAQSFGQMALAGISPKSLQEVRQSTGFPSLKKETQAGKEAQALLTPRGGAERLGSLAEGIAEFALPVGAIGKSAKATGAISKTGGLTAESVLGTEGVKAISSAVKNPEIQSKILKGEITTNTIANKISSLAKKVRDKSMKALEKTRGGIRGSVRSDDLIKSVTKVANNAKEKVSLLDEEQRIVKNLSTFLAREIKGGTAVSKKKIDSLIRKIDDANFFREGEKFKGSNKVVQAVRDRLRTITKQGNPKFASQLEKASKVDIPFFEKLGKNIVGRDGNLNVDLLQNKVNQLVKAIDDPNKKAESLNLLRELSKRVGAKADFLEELDAFSKAQPLLKGLTGISSPFKTVQELGQRGLSAGARGIGRTINRFR